MTVHIREEAKMQMKSWAHWKGIMPTTLWGKLKENHLHCKKEKEGDIEWEVVYVGPRITDNSFYIIIKL